MKYIYSIIIILILSSCSSDKTDSVSSIDSIISSGNLKEMRKMKSHLDTKKQEISNEIKKLETKIKQLDPQGKIPLVTTFEVKEELFNHYLQLQGSVETKQNIVVFPEFSGLLNRIYVKDGQRVKKGQLLAKVDDAGLSQQLSQIRIQAELAKTTFERQKRLWDQKIGSQMQYLQAKSSFEVQQKAVSQIQKQVSKTVVRAPFSGIIDDVIAKQGSFVGAGQAPLFRIVNLNNMYIKTAVPEQHISNITKGKSVVVEFPILSKTIDARVRQVSAFLNPQNRTFNIEIGVPNKDKTIKPNLTAKLKINDYTNKKALLIPQSIISENAEGKQYVYTIVDKNNNKAKAKKVIVKTGKSKGDLIEILEGLKSGDEVIEEGARSVKDSQEVKMLKESK